MANELKEQMNGYATLAMDEALEGARRATSSLTWSPLGLPGIQLVTVRRVKIAAIHSDFDRGDASVPDGIR